MVSKYKVKLIVSTLRSAYLFNNHKYVVLISQFLKDKTIKLEPLNRYKVHLNCLLRNCGKKQNISMELLFY